MRYIRAHLDRLSAGTLPRAMLFIPPRHGKSTLSTIYYPAYRLECNPALRIIIACYNQTLAEKFSRRVRAVVRAGGVVALNPERQAVDDWETTAGGGVRAVGVGGGVTGMGADLVIIDDPVKSREEANSEAYRERCFDWYTNDLYTRLEPGASILLIMTRWHTDDLAGRILRSENAPDWTVISLPAEAEEDDPLGRAVGEALCPARYPIAALKDLERTLHDDYTALFQQRPQPKEGRLFQRAWFGLVPASPMVASRVRYWDKAGTKGGSGAQTAGVLMARDTNGLYYVEDVITDRLGAVEREALILQTAQLDQQRYGRVAIWVEQEPGSGGKESAEATVRRLAGFIAAAERVTGDKVYRAEPFASQSKAGNVKLVAGAWNDGYLAQLTSFPSGLKDMVDASSGALNKLALPLGMEVGPKIYG